MRQVLFGIDDLLSGFEDVKRKSGSVQGFAFNPLSSIDFAEVFKSLGYQTKPPSDFGFVKRNLHFAAACAAGAKQKLPLDLRILMGAALPDDPGMVRVSTEPPGIAQGALRYEDRYIDVPAASSAFRGIDNEDSSDLLGTDDLDDAPLVVPLDAPYAANGKYMVSTRTAQHVGYNGIQFRKLRACPEMRDSSKSIVRRAWPRGLLEANEYSRTQGSAEPFSSSESLKRAPLNWIVRKPVMHFARSETDWAARYPPRNLLNSLYRKGPRETCHWVPTPTYAEPPFPILEGTAACSSMRLFAEEHNDIHESLHLLNVLKAVYRAMSNRDGVTDRWLQRKVTEPNRRALEGYRNEMRIYSERENGSPIAPRTVRQLYKQDQGVLEKVDAIMSNHSVSEADARRLRKRTITQLFEEAENSPGALDRFYVLAEMDHERYARDLTEFKRVQRQFDQERGLLPTRTSPITQ